MQRIVKTMSSGVNVELLDPKADQILFSDISKTVNNLERFSGQIEKSITVGRHTVHVVELASNISTRMQQIAFLHDLQEAYVGDIITPMKMAVKAISGIDAIEWIEDGFKELIFEIAGVDYPTEREWIDMHRIDKAAGIWEAIDGGIDVGEFGEFMTAEDSETLNATQILYGDNWEAGFNRLGYHLVPDLFNWEGGQ